MWALKPVSCPLLFPGCYGFFLLHIYTSFFPTTKHHYIFPFSNAEKTFLCWQNYEVIYSVKSWVVKSARKTNSNSQQQRRHTKVPFSHSDGKTWMYGILFTKLFWLTVRKLWSSNQERLLKFKAEGQEFAKSLRSLDQFVQTVKGQYNFWKRMLF